jgi:hypothetical protein
MATFAVPAAPEAVIGADLASTAAQPSIRTEFSQVFALEAFDATLRTKLGSEGDENNHSNTERGSRTTCPW